MGRTLQSNNENSTRRPRLPLIPHSWLLLSTGKTVVAAALAALVLQRNLEALSSAACTVFSSLYTSALTSRFLSFYKTCSTEESENTTPHHLVFLLFWPPLRLSLPSHLPVLLLFQGIHQPHFLPRCNLLP